MRKNLYMFEIVIISMIVASFMGIFYFYQDQNAWGGKYKIKLNELNEIQSYQQQWLEPLNHIELMSQLHQAFKSHQLDQHLKDFQVQPELGMVEFKLMDLPQLKAVNFLIVLNDFSPSLIKELELIPSTKLGYLNLSFRLAVDRSSEVGETQGDQA